MAAARARPTRALRRTRGPASTRPAPRGSQGSRSPVRQVAAPAADPRDRPDFRQSDGRPVSAPARADSPRVMPETRCVSKNWGWWPGAESNHRHADFQYDGERALARPSRRTGTRFSVTDRTAPPDRPYPEPEPGEPSPRPACPIRFNGLRASRPNSSELAPNGTPRRSALLVPTVRLHGHGGRGAETWNPGRLDVANAWLGHITSRDSPRVALPREN